MPNYRYQFLGFDTARLIQEIPGASANGVVPVLWADVDVEESDKKKLDLFMRRHGYIPHSTSPEEGLEDNFFGKLKSRISFFQDKEFVGKRDSINFDKNSIEVKKNPSLKAVDVSALDVRDVVIFDHFMGSSLSLGGIGSLGWETYSTGVGSAVSFASEPRRPGVISIKGSAAVSGVSAIGIGDVGDGSRIQFKGRPISSEFLVKFPSSSDVAPANLLEFSTGFGLAWGSNAELPSGVYIRYMPGSDSTFSLVTAQGGTRSVEASSVTPIGDSWYRLGIEILPGPTTAVQMKINGINEGAPLTANIPSSGMGLGVKIRSNGGSGAEAFIDYALVKQETAKED